MSDDVRPDPNQPELDGSDNDAVEAAQAQEAANSDTFEQASNGTPEAPAEDVDAAEVSEADEEIESIAEPGPSAKLERLQKILAQAGIASRRHAEELITQGRVQVNGKVVTELGTKADAARDHIRVDGKLLQGSERLRYYMLNKPKGFVTTVSDPEGRATVMQFFAKSRERLYPVGRLDYLSEGLLLVTNDGDLANKLTRAAAGVEKTYLVKVSGEPTEEELDQLREGVGIERGKPGSGRVQTAPAQIRKVRQGDNPWYEVIIIEGRNRELRKMFEEIGHHVEKIRRVGYGPLVLDLEPGKMRELESEELEDLRKAADGKFRKPKARDNRLRNASRAQLPTQRPRLVRPQAAPPEGERPAFSSRREFPPKKQFGAARPQRPERQGNEGFRPRPERPTKSRSDFGPQRSGFGPERSGTPQFGSNRPAWKKDDRSPRPPTQFGQRPARSTQGPDRFGSGPAREHRPAGGFTAGSRSEGGRPFDKKPWKKPDASRPPFKSHAGPHRDEPGKDEDFKPSKSSRLRIEPVGPDQGSIDSPVRRPSTRPESRPGARSGSRASSDRPSYRGASGVRPGGGRSGAGRPSGGRASYDRPRADRPNPNFDRPKYDRPKTDRPRPERPQFERSAGDRPPGGHGRPGSGAFGAGSPPRSESDRSRPFTTSTGKPRAGGARPSNKHGGASTAGKPAWKSKPSGTGRPPSGTRSKSTFGSKSGSGYKGKASGGRKQTGPRPSGKPSGKRSEGKKRS